MLPQSCCHCDGSFVSQRYQYYKFSKGVYCSQYVLVTSGGFGEVSSQVYPPHLNWVTGCDRVQLSLARGCSSSVIAGAHVTSFAVVCDVIAPSVPVAALAHMSPSLKSSKVAGYS